MDPNIDKAFVDTTKLIFGKPLTPTEKYADWLTNRIARNNVIDSALGNGTINLPDYGFLGKMERKRITAFEDLFAAEGKKLTTVVENETNATLTKKLASIAYFVPAFVEGNNINVKNTTIYLDCINIYNSFDIFKTKNSAYIFSIIDSEALFGCYRVMASKFCIHCYNITNLSACFEMDLAKNCSNSMFCHNVENVHNSMFCFNVKNKNWAIGNVEVGREQYLKIKDKLTEEIVESLEKEGSFGKDIYNAI